MRGVRRGRTAAMRPHHVGISVGDLEGSIAWYRDKLGFALLRVVEIPEAEDAGRVALLERDDFIIELFCLPGAAPLPEDRRHPTRDIMTHGVKHVAYAVADLEAVMDELKAKDVDVAWDVAVHDNTRCAFVRDNTGNLVELVERK